MKLALLSEEGQSSGAVVLLAEEHAHGILGERQLRIETMRFLKVTKGGVHLGHLLFENTASQVETRFRWKLLNAKSKEIRSYLEGAVIEGHLSEGQVCVRVSRVQLDRFAEPLDCLRSVVVGFGKLGSEQERRTVSSIGAKQRLQRGECGGAIFCGCLGAGERDSVRAVVL